MNDESDFEKWYRETWPYANSSLQRDSLHDAWEAGQAVFKKNLAKPFNLLIGWAQSGSEISDDAPFYEWTAKLIEYANEAAKAWDEL